MNTETDWKTIVARAKRGLREEMRLYLVAISSLAVAFLCVGGALLFDANLGAMAERWGESGRMSVYLADGAAPTDVMQLQTVLEGLPEVSGVELISAEAARAAFLDDAQMASELSGLPADAFPSSLEVSLAAGTPVQRGAAIASRVGEFRAVSDVETYRGFFDRLNSLVAAGRGVAGVLALLVALCVFAVIGNTIRLAIARRRGEIEVMKLCGATDRFVRSPFVLEGTFQGLAAALLAVVVLVISFLVIQHHLDGSVAALTGIQAQFLAPSVLVALVVGGGLVGALGSALSLRRYLAV
ncbi:MAG: cell division transport system permease protein [Polyangiales bacterium]